MRKYRRRDNAAQIVADSLRHWLAAPERFREDLNRQTASDPAKRHEIMLEIHSKDPEAFEILSKMPKVTPSV